MEINDSQELLKYHITFIFILKLNKETILNSVESHKLC